MTTQRVVVFGIGNGARGDGGLGPALISHLQASPLGDNWWLTLIEDAQLQIEHAVDLQSNDLALFVDASETTAPPFRFQLAAVSQRPHPRGDVPPDARTSRASFRSYA